MRVIGVIDLADGRAVHARAGDRARYHPVESLLLQVPGDALGLARAYVERCGLDELYVADLDALAGRSAQRELLRAIATSGVRASMVDAGIDSVPAAAGILASGAARVIVALETLPDYGCLAEIIEAVGRDRVVFSLDLRDGVPLVSPRMTRELPLAHLERATRAGVTAAIVLDLARVGVGGGVDGRLLGAARDRFPELELLVGGGVRNASDLERLAALGCDGALVATAILRGDLTREHLGTAGRAADHPSVSR